MAQMLEFQPLTAGTTPPAGTPYGLGQMYTLLPVAAFQKGDPRNLTYVGHGGEDWGSGFPSANWMPQFNLSLIVGLNNGESPVGMNSSLSWTQNAVLIAACYCLTADVLFRFHGQPGVSCHASELNQVGATQMPPRGHHMGRGRI